MKKDKILHLIVGMIISLIVVMIFENVYFAVAVSALAGMIKEIWDNGGRGHVEFLDFLYTVIGGFVGVIGWNIISHLI